MSWDSPRLSYNRKPSSSDWILSAVLGTLRTQSVRITGTKYKMRSTVHCTWAHTMYFCTRTSVRFTWVQVYLVPVPSTFVLKYRYSVHFRCSTQNVSETSLPNPSNTFLRGIQVSSISLFTFQVSNYSIQTNLSLTSNVSPRWISNSFCILSYISGYSTND